MNPQTREEAAQEKYPDIMGISQGSYRGAFLAGTKWQNKQLLDVVSELRGALEFYAEIKHWKTITIENYNQKFCIMQGSDLEYFQEPNRDSYCGKTARHAIDKVDAMMKEMNNDRK